MAKASEVNQIDREKLVAIRKKRMKRTELAVKTGYGEKQIYNLESGKGRVSERLIDRVCEVLEIERKQIQPRETARRAS